MQSAQPAKQPARWDTKSARTNYVDVPSIIANQNFDAKATAELAIEIMSTRTNKQIDDIKKAYPKMYDTELKMDVEKTTSGYSRRLLISLYVPWTAMSTHKTPTSIRPRRMLTNFGARARHVSAPRKSL
uniref:Annexin n=1 Tax=Globodera pallida TaxID=36090 RepID=A0A183CJ02_GLOPA